MNRIVVDLDGTLTEDDSSRSYAEKRPQPRVVEKLREYKEVGFTITVLTARNMRSFEGNVGLINVHTLPTVLAWLDQHGVPYDEVVVGKPWCGEQGFYVDDRALRPDEFVSLSPAEVSRLFGRNRD
jgi:capsule biosynthesis phosphatase